MCMKFRTFGKKHEYPSLIISEITDCERGVYLKVQKVVLEKTVQ